jgi:glycosyltransferase involved in cell wall biosynthesis
MADTHTRVAILVPVLARPQNVAPLIASVEAATSEAHRLVFVVNDDDEAELEALTAAGADHVVVGPARRSYACKINDGFNATTEPVVFSAADDVRFHAGWFKAAAGLLGDGVEVVGTNDSCNMRTVLGFHSTHTLFTRGYIERCGTIDEPGKVLCEKYKHDYCDDEFIETAKARGVYAHAFDSIVEHLHPMVNKAADDDTYRLGRRWSPNGHSVYKTRRHLWQR